jgi:hypothetical protein
MSELYVKRKKCDYIYICEFVGCNKIVIKMNGTCFQIVTSMSANNNNNNI